ncbi:OLC1v1035885C1 [Oldenlandia corymbosa var. corymbosa]|uniref:phospholipase A2 n=1 Tax=Oldenlandia corymbosa var. corymbosa TaxID=529605 RepID=A0AAV1CWJ2_OLDCO|nr:OLC1v1035885C1 [Oldenlandia corymbosa var. corymbosa]
MAALSKFEPFVFARFLLIFLFSIQMALHFHVVPTIALRIGVNLEPSIQVKKECSRKCESKYCGLAPFLRYGKYCGVLYSGCPGEAPCDGLDACCMKHDQCIQRKNNDYLNEECNQTFLNCVNAFKKSKAPTFHGNTCSVDEVVKVIDEVIEAAIIAGKLFPHN